MRRKNQDELSEEVLCAEYEAVYRYALTLCRSESDAQDVTQETFLKAMRSSSGFRGDSSLYTWLCAIARNLWLNRCKKKRREVASEKIPDLPQSAPPVEQAMLQRETALEIHAILHGMSEPYKEVFTLRVFGQLSFAEIAKLFSKTESWARVTYHRARKMIGEQLSKEGNHEE